ncbi:hypothetical protein H2200_003508 [Cladophialophora chaetospira]|uniref:VOC domain-containing protein n=1 Tax=Cladophialophora chaetospira TaxID=386627 RepID=A0AA39CMS3_9EURO|nr:hypothetical protein H2200_003508 [Cladophialophora chaetospira]
MLINTLLPLALLLASQPWTQPQACALEPRQASTAEPGNITYPWAQPGDDNPSSPATMGYFINHLCINVRNATKSIDWYNRAFGLRLIFTAHISEHFSISYLGHAHGGRNGTGYQTSLELNREKNNAAGLIELLHLDFPEWDLPSGSKVPNTFSHIGMVVPNVTDTQIRLEAMGANIIKGAGEPFTGEGPFAAASGFTSLRDQISPEEKETILATLGPLNKPLLIVADPDGTIIEVQNQEGSQVV